MHSSSQGYIEILDPVLLGVKTFFAPEVLRVVLESENAELGVSFFQ